MEMPKCTHCGEALDGWVEYCPHCSEAVEGYTRPAGFWIRVGASIIDGLVFIPIPILAFWNMLSLRNTTMLVLLAIPGFLYKPFMEAYFGATLGKMSCGIKVIDAEGKKLSLFTAYIRAFPFLMASGVDLARQIVLYSSEQFQAASSWVEASQVRTETFLDFVSPIVSLLLLVDCVFVAFTFRKRALHDMLAESFCVYKEP